MPSSGAAVRGQAADRVRELCLDRPHLPAPPARRELALLHTQGRAHRKTSRALRPEIWDPLPSFTTVRHDHQVRNVTRCLALPRRGARRTLPERLLGGPRRDPFRARARDAGRRSALRDAARQHRDARTGLEEHGHLPRPGTTGAASTTTCAPPTIDGNGYGIRVPRSSSARTRSAATSTTRSLSFDAFNKFIEDDFLGGQRIDPKTMGAPTRAPTSARTPRSSATSTADFDFHQRPRPPDPLPLDPRARAGEYTGRLAARSSTAARSSPPTYDEALRFAGVEAAEQSTG